MKKLFEPLRRPELLVLFVIGLWCSAAIRHFRNVQLDDAFITYRFARNIAGGMGFAYNPPQQVFGTTTPFYVLILAAAKTVTLDIPDASLFINFLSIGALAIATYLLSNSEKNGWNALLPAILVVILPGTYTILGMETLLYTALIYGGFYFLNREKFTAAIILAAIATLTRYDGVLFMVIIILAESFSRRALPWRSLLLFASLLIPWLVYATLTFGSPLPNTLYAKAGALQFTFLEGLPDGLFQLLFFANAHSIMPPVLFFLVGMMVAGLVVSLRIHSFRWLSVWILLYITGYHVLGLRYVQHWYYYPILPGLLLLMTNGFQYLSKLAGDRLARIDLRIGWLARQSLIVIALFPMGSFILLGMAGLWNTADRIAELGGRYQVYKQAALWVCTNTDAETSIAVPEIGIIGWFCDHRIIDPYGLVTPEMVSYIREDDRLAGLASLEPDVVIIQNYPKDTPIIFPDAGSFRDNYLPVRVFQESYFPHAVVIFSREP